MATLVPGSAPQNITDGGGAAAVTVDVMNAMWNNAMAKASAGITNANQALALAGPAPQVANVTLDTSYLPPNVPTLPNDDPNNGEAIYTAQRDYLLALIEDNMASFIAEYFPPVDFFEDAYDWATRALTTGGTGINVGVEQAIWQRGRARILMDSSRVEMEAAVNWANRGFPVPPGALLGQQQDIRLDAGRKLAEVSRDIAIKSFDTEIENVRIAFKEVMDFRRASLASTLEYLKTLMQGPQIAADLAGRLVGIRSELARNLTQLYSAQVEAVRPKVQLAIADADLKMRAEQLNQSAKQSTIAEQVRIALAAVQILASQSSAGLNAIGARSSISGADSSNV